VTPPSPPSLGSPPASRGSRIFRVLRSRFFQCAFFCGAAGYLEAVIYGSIGNHAVPPMIGVVTTQGVVLIIMAVRSRAGSAGGLWRNRNPQRRSGVPIRHASGHDAMPPVSGPIAGAAWQVMRAAARLMPRAAGRRWLAEAASFLSEAPPAQRHTAFRSYLAAAPQTILTSWASHLTRRSRAR
jgi:hypothetical protein